MRRGEIWTADAGSGYSGKPRPVVIVQDDRFDATGSVTVCAFTTDPTEAPLIRLPVEPDERNGLRVPCSLMVDKITSVPRSKLGERVGRLAEEDIVRLGRAIVVFLGLAGN
jgi:mRNA interferase MazF